MQYPVPRTWSTWQRHTTKLTISTLLALLIVFHFSGRTFSTARIPAEKIRSSKASRLSPADLMSRPLIGTQSKIPKIFHQSWSSTKLPAKFKHWSETCMKEHSDWEYVLWTDDDNLELVKRFMPGFLPMYEKLEGPIFQADLIRNAYMYLFGGVYSDLDMECLRPSDELFGHFNVSTLPRDNTSTALIAQSDATTQRPDSKPANQKCFVGRMGTDDSFEHGIPNAWMASPPGHPFFKLMLQWTKEKVMSNEDLDQRPEAVTGPIALRKGIEKFNKHEYHEAGAKRSDEHALDDDKVASSDDVLGEASIEVLPSHYIYPYSWGRDGDVFREFCSAERESFDAERCKNLIAVDHWPSYTITYWSHTWEWKGHNENNIKKLEEMKGG